MRPARQGADGGLQPGLQLPLQAEYLPECAAVLGDAGVGPRASDAEQDIGGSPVASAREKG